MKQRVADFSATCDRLGDQLKRLRGGA
jgi:hypothetical protein